MLCKVRHRPIWLLFYFLVIFTTFTLSGCASYSDKFQSIEKELSEHDPEDALKELEKQDHSSSDELLYHLNKTMLLRMQKDFRGSNEQIELAKQFIEEYAATSVTETTASFTVNDTMRTYTATPLEQIMLNTYAAMNYLESGELDAARVEALQTDLRIRQLLESDPENVLHIDPFARYLTGMIYEDQGEWSDAMIAYRKAYQAYLAHAQIYDVSVPEYLKFDLLRMAKRNGLKNELKKLKLEFGIVSPKKTTKNGGQGEVVIFFHKSLAPVLIEQSVTQIDPGTGILIRFSLPYYQSRPSRLSHIRVMHNEQMENSQAVEHLDLIAKKNLEDALPAITARAFARAVTKYSISRNVQRQDDLVGLLFNVMTVMTEQADTRSWLTLPAEVHMARLKLPIGEQTISIELIDIGGSVTYSTELKNVVIETGKRRYYSYHWIAPTMTRH